MLFLLTLFPWKNIYISILLLKYTFFNIKDQFFFSIVFSLLTLTLFFLNSISPPLHSDNLCPRSSNLSMHQNPWGGFAKTDAGLEPRVSDSAGLVCEHTHKHLYLQEVSSWSWYCSLGTTFWELYTYIKQFHNATINRLSDYISCCLLLWPLEV